MGNSDHGTTYTYTASRYIYVYSITTYTYTASLHIRVQHLGLALQETHRGRTWSRDSGTRRRLRSSSDMIGRRKNAKISQHPKNISAVTASCHRGLALRVPGRAF